MGRRVMLGEVVGFVESAFLPVYMELALANAIANPVESHVDGFGATLFDSVIGDADGGAIVGLDESGRLRMAHLGQGGPNDSGVLAVDINASELRFGGATHDVAENPTRGVNGSVEWGEGSSDEGAVVGSGRLVLR